MQIQYNITRIEEWCKSHDMPEGTLQLEHLMQATKLLQLKKSTPADLEIIYDVCWMLTPTQIQRMCTNYYVADYEVRCLVLRGESLADTVPSDTDLPRDPSRRRITSIAQRPQRPPAPCTRDGGGRPVRAALAPRGVWAGDVRARIPECAPSAEARCSGSIAGALAVMSIRFSIDLHISLCYGIQCNGNLRLSNGLFSGVSVCEVILFGIGVVQW